MLTLVAISCLTAVLIVVFCVFSSVFRSIQKSKMEADLKRDMLDRGMSADEIEKVIRATRPNDFIERAIDRRHRH